MTLPRIIGKIMWITFIYVITAEWMNIFAKGPFAVEVDNGGGLETIWMEWT